MCDGKVIVNNRYEYAPYEKLLNIKLDDRFYDFDKSPRLQQHFQNVRVMRHQSENRPWMGVQKDSNPVKLKSPGDIMYAQCAIA